jgi:hypothetical protein
MLLLPALQGCLIPYAFPKVSQTPLLSLGETADEIHTFRVDITRDFVDISGTDHCTLTELSSWPAGWVLPQTKVSASYGIFVFGVALNYPVYISHSLALKVYRAGYELVELDSWQLPTEIVWKQALDLAAQEDALDRLYLLMEDENRATKPMLFWTIGLQLSPGSESAEHRRVLLFGASEYERLARRAASERVIETARRRLQSKAQRLRDLAGQVEPSPGLTRLLRGE